MKSLMLVLMLAVVGMGQGAECTHDNRWIDYNGDTTSISLGSTKCKVVVGSNGVYVQLEFSDSTYQFIPLEGIDVVYTDCEDYTSLRYCNRVETPYHRGEIHGIRKTYDANDSLVLEETYNNGTFIAHTIDEPFPNFNKNTDVIGMGMSSGVAQKLVVTVNIDECKITTVKFRNGRVSKVKDFRGIDYSKSGHHDSVESIMNSFGPYLTFNFVSTSTNEFYYIQIPYSNAWDGCY